MRRLALCSIGLAMYAFSAQAADAPLSAEAKALIQPVFDAYATLDKQLAAEPPAATTAAQLIRLGRIDDTGRNAYATVSLVSLPEDQRNAAFDTVYAEINRRDADSLAHLKALLPPDGWFLKSDVGAEAADAAWLVVQHAINMNPDFMPVVLARMEKLLPSGEIDTHRYAMLYDRVSSIEGRRQRYGSQKICLAHKWTLYPVEDMAGVNARRKAMGFETTTEQDMAELAAKPPCPINYDKPLPKQP